MTLRVVTGHCDISDDGSLCSSASYCTCNPVCVVQRRALAHLVVHVAGNMATEVRAVDGERQGRTVRKVPSCIDAAHHNEQF